MLAKNLKREESKRKKDEENLNSMLGNLKENDRSLEFDAETLKEIHLISESITDPNAKNLFNAKMK